MFEKIYEEVYTQRRELLMNEMSEEMFDEMVKDFDRHVESMEGLDKVEINPCDV